MLYARGRMGGDSMSFRYKANVMGLLKEKGYSSTRLRREKLLGESYMSQLRRGEMVSWAALDTICTLLDCQPGDLIEHQKPAGVDKTGKNSCDF